MSLQYDLFQQQQLNKTAHEKAASVDEIILTSKQALPARVLLSFAQLNVSWSFTKCDEGYFERFKT